MAITEQARRKSPPAPAGESFPDLQWEKIERRDAGPEGGGLEGGLPCLLSQPRHNRPPPGQQGPFQRNRGVFTRLAPAVAGLHLQYLFWQRPANKGPSADVAF